MATIAEQLTSLANTKTAIKDAIVAKGVAVADTDPFSEYPAKIGQISGGGAPATKLGASIDNMIGDVDADGNYVPPTKEFVVDLLGVKSVGPYDMEYLFVNKPVVGRVDASTIVNIGNSGMRYAFRDCPGITSVDFSSLESLGTYSLSATFLGTKLSVVFFPKLTTVQSNSFGLSTSAAFPISVVELHFRADMQATIEGMSGYSSKFGAANATIYYDL